MAGERWAIYAGADARSFGDLVAGGDLGTEAPSAYDERSADAKALVRASASTLLTFAYQHVRQSDVPRYDQVAQRGYLRYGFDPQERQLAYAARRPSSRTPGFASSKRLSRSSVRSRAASGSAGESLEIRERDEVETLGLLARGPLRAAPGVAGDLGRRGLPRPRGELGRLVRPRDGRRRVAPGPLPGRRHRHEPRRVHPALARPRAAGPDPRRPAQLLRDLGRRPGGRADRRPAAGARGQRLGALPARRGAAPRRVGQQRLPGPEHQRHRQPRPLRLRRRGPLARPRAREVADLRARAQGAGGPGGERRGALRHEPERPHRARARPPTSAARRSTATASTARRTSARLG